MASNKRLIKNRDVEQIGSRMCLTLWGEDFGSKMLRNPNVEYNEGLMELGLTAWSWFERPQLDARTRALCIVCVLAASNLLNETKLWTIAALNLGCTGEQIKEAVMQVAPYAGIAHVHSAMYTINETVKNYREPRRNSSNK